jgi:hypothetical protein
MLTAWNITKAQIRELMRGANNETRYICRIALGLPGYPPPCTRHTEPGSHEYTHECRGHCAAMINARNAARKERP